MALKDYTSTKLLVREETDPETSPLTSVIEVLVEDRLLRLTGKRRLISLSWLSKAVKHLPYDVYHKVKDTEIKGRGFNMSFPVFATLVENVIKRTLTEDKGFTVSVVNERKQTTQRGTHPYLCIELH